MLRLILCVSQENGIQIDPNVEAQREEGEIRDSEVMMGGGEDDGLATLGDDPLNCCLLLRQSRGLTKAGSELFMR